MILLGVGDADQRAQGFEVTDLDDVLYRIESEIKLLIEPTGLPPQPVRADRPAVAVEDLAPDRTRDA